jgi:hypothetical protein
MAADCRGRAFHPENNARLRSERLEALSRDVAFKNEQRILRKDGQYRWFLIQYNPLLDDQGRVIRWYATGTDIDDRVRAEKRTPNENLALRERKCWSRSTVVARWSVIQVPIPLVPSICSDQTPPSQIPQSL